MTVASMIGFKALLFATPRFEPHPFVFGMPLIDALRFSRVAAAASVGIAPAGGGDGRGGFDGAENGTDERGANQRSKQEVHGTLLCSATR
jgi:hypothetical protein